MAESEAAHLQDCYRKRICPFCGGPLKSGEEVGSGQIEKGLFCSLKCYASYHQKELMERHRKQRKDLGGQKND
jgi:hypothetical protein